MTRTASDGGQPVVDMQGVTTGISLPLSDDVNLLGELLGAAIRGAAGDAVFRRVEELRLLCKRAAEADDPALLEEAAAQIGVVDDDELAWLLRSYSAFFHLVNQAEKREILRVNRERSRAAGDGGPARPESIADAIARLDIQPTAHDEVEQGLYFLESTIWETAARIHRDAERALRESVRRGCRARSTGRGASSAASPCGTSVNPDRRADGRGGGREASG